jgi:hypothetical protein
MQQQQQQNHQQAVQQQPAPAIGIPGAADDAFSIVTQAGAQGTEAGQLHQSINSKYATVF